MDFQRNSADASAVVFLLFFLPFNFGITFDALTTAVLTYVLNYAAYFAEIYRGGINSIDRGQYEAAHALGLSRETDDV